ncbi:MAG: EAL domain-containing protein [Dokdonella sp.]
MNKESAEQIPHVVEFTETNRRDAVTGLPRFTDPDEAFQSALDAAVIAGDLVAVYCLDIDRFHAVNNSVGRRGGDEILRSIAQRLHVLAPERERLWRLGNDEFLILAIFPSEDGPRVLADKIHRVFELPLPLAGYEFFISASIGYACYPTHAANAVDLFGCAQAALSQARSRGRGAVQTLSSTHAEELRERMALGARLRSAITANEFVLHYQPQVRAPDGRIVGVEGLIRWQASDLGLLSPHRFLGVAEELGLIVELGRWVLHEACHQSRLWLDAGHNDITVSINISSLQLHRRLFVDEVGAALRAAGIPPAMLELELTENAIMDDVSASIDIMTALKQLGVRLALDDFGVGYSSLRHLPRFPIDRLKIDPAFIRDVAIESGGTAIVRAITVLGHELRMSVMAEGVETEAQLGYLLRNHCDGFQGYLFGRPTTADEVTRVLHGRFIESTLMRSAASPGRGLLLVDDEPNVLKSLARLLRREGYEIHMATGAKEGFDILARHKIQVIVSDQRMPGISGTEFLSQVKEMYPDTVRMVLSGYTDLATVTSAINRGAIYRFLTKPWDDEDLRTQISEAFRSFDSRKQHSISDG